MPDVERGRYLARVIKTKAEFVKVLRFRSNCFGLGSAEDADHLDERCTHVVIEERSTSNFVCYFRMKVMPAAQVRYSYAAQFYDLCAMESMEGPLLELGRFCLSPECNDPDALRLAWAAITKVVDRHHVTMLFGCTSFEGNEPARYLDAFSFLKINHLAPRRCAPRIKAPEVLDFAELGVSSPVKEKALQQMPPLLRSYLSMGAWVSDHVVVDRDLRTLHVFTGLEIDAIPAERKRLLRAI